MFAGEAEWIEKMQADHAEFEAAAREAEEKSLQLWTIAPGQAPKSLGVLSRAERLPSNRGRLAARRPVGRRGAPRLRGALLADDHAAKGLVHPQQPAVQCHVRDAGGSVFEGVEKTLLADAGQKVTAAISLEVDDEAMVGRVSGRYTCACGEGYHDQFKKPAVAGTCDKCGGTSFKRRADDNAETVRERLKAYHAQTAPLITYYAGRGVLQKIDAMGAIADIRTALGQIVQGVAA